MDNPSIDKTKSAILLTAGTIDNNHSSIQSYSRFSGVRTRWVHLFKISSNVSKTLFPVAPYTIEIHCPNSPRSAPKPVNPTSELCVQVRSGQAVRRAQEPEALSAKVPQRRIFYENVTNRIPRRLRRVVQPRSVTVESHWKARGGITSIITASYEKPA